MRQILFLPCNNCAYSLQNFGHFKALTRSSNAVETRCLGNISINLVFEHARRQRSSLLNILSTSLFIQMHNTFCGAEQRLFWRTHPDHPCSKCCNTPNVRPAYLKSAGTYCNHHLPIISWKSPWYNHQWNTCDCHFPEARSAPQSLSPGAIFSWVHQTPHELHDTIIALPSSGLKMRVMATKVFMSKCFRISFRNAGIQNW